MSGEDTDVLAHRQTDRETDRQTCMTEHRDTQKKNKLSLVVDQLIYLRTG